MIFTMSPDFDTDNVFLNTANSTQVKTLQSHRSVDLHKDKYCALTLDFVKHKTIVFKCASCRQSHSIPEK